MRSIRCRAARFRPRRNSSRAFPPSAGSQADANYAQFTTAIAGLYAAYYPRLVTGDTKTATDLLNAIAGGIEDATASYVTTPPVTANLAASPVSF